MINLKTETKRIARIKLLIVCLLIACLCCALLPGCDRKLQQANSTDASSISVGLLITSAGVSDDSYVQPIYESLKTYCEEHNFDFGYYQPTRETTVELEPMIDVAVADGRNVIITTAYNYGPLVAKAQYTYPEVTFVCMDVTEADFEGTPIENNTVLVSTQEEYAGYFAGYAAVASGYNHIGMLGGIAIPSVLHYEAGYLQGANDAALMMGNSQDVTVEVVMGNQFYGDSDITAYMDTWYNNKGVQCVFSCGGGIYTSVAEAAQKVNGKTLGVDSDQKKSFDKYAQNMCITSAVKNLNVVALKIMDIIVSGNFANYGGKCAVMGIVSSDPEKNFVGIPLASTQWSNNFTQDTYYSLVNKLYEGELTVSNQIPAKEELSITYNDWGTIK